MISVWLLIVAEAIQHAKLVNEKVTQTIIANQIASAGVEAIYQNRNTNLLSWDYWLNISDGNLWEWYYYIDQFDENWKISIKKCEHVIQSNNKADCSDSKTKINGSEIYAICLLDWIWQPCWDRQDENESNYWMYYRVIEWLWLYNMENNITWWVLSEDDDNWIDPNDPLEYRFCSRVYWYWWLWGDIKICSTLANF